jgi:hypothetical protein
LGNLGKVGCQEEIGGKAHGNFPLLRLLCVGKGDFSKLKKKATDNRRCLSCVGHASSSSSPKEGKDDNTKCNNDNTPTNDKNHENETGGSNEQQKQSRVLDASTIKELYNGEK